jgi:hypothetical protein
LPNSKKSRSNTAPQSTTTTCSQCFYANLNFHQTLFELCGNACLIETIKTLEQKVYGIRLYANAVPEALERAHRDHLDMIEAPLRRHQRGKQLGGRLLLCADELMWRPVLAQGCRLVQRNRVGSSCEV